ncbi:MAG: response regulator [Leptolinea sp.]|nr:response regulator [Leptolinea sp.]
MSTDVILLVDDEANVLSSLSRTLFEEDFGEILTANNASEALEILEKGVIPSVVISDYHMPGINGIDLLSAIRKRIPETTRILLTGAAALDMAINAVNKGNVFRFLVKPCPSDVFINAVKDGIRYNQLVLGEKELLVKTLNGSIKVMIDILEVQNPLIFTKVGRLRKLAHNLALALDLKDQMWEIELAALLSQIGSVTIPQDILYKQIKGVELSDSEREMIASIPRMGRQLIKNIPRLENVAEAVGNQNLVFTNPVKSDSLSGDNIPIISRILKIVLDYDRLRTTLFSSVDAINQMQAHENDYDPSILSVFCTRVLEIDEQITYKATKARLWEKQIFVDDLKIGMTLSRDVVDRNGTLIVAKKTVVTEVLIFKLSNYFRSQSIMTPVFIESDTP